MSLLLLALVLAFGGARPIDAIAATVSQSSHMNACDFLTVRHITAVIQMKVDPGRRHDTGRLNTGIYSGAYSSTCVWRASADRNAHDPNLPLGGANFVILVVIVWPQNSNGPAHFLQTFRDAAQDRTIARTPVPLRIGDEALWWGDGVAARRGNFAFGISVHLLQKQSQQRRMEEQLANYVSSEM